MGEIQTFIKKGVKTMVQVLMPYLRSQCIGDSVLFEDMDWKAVKG